MAFLRRPLLAFFTLWQFARSDGGPFDCGDEPYLMLEEVLHNNLGGHGPHHGEEGIIYQAVEYYKNMHRIVHVNLHAVSSYTPWDSFANGLNGRFGVFTQEAGHALDVVFSFTTVDKKPVELRTFTISFYDMDRDKKPGEGVEMVIPKQPYTMVYMSNTTQIKKVGHPDGTFSFEGTEKGTYQDNPVKVVHEQKLDEDRCVAFEFKNVKKVHMRIQSTAGFMARTTQFACLNSFMCKVVPDRQTAWHKDTAEEVEVGPQDSNQAPIRARTGLLFEYTFPKHLFLGDDLIFKTTMLDGRPLPSWLHFNPKTCTLSGTPSASDRGVMNVKVRSINSAGVEASTTLTLDIGGGPALAKPIPLQRVRPGKDFVYALPKGMFIDTMDGEKLNFKATSKDGSELPNWLHFDPAQGRFYGLPPADAHGVLEVWLTAIDSQHFSVTDKFDMIVGDGIGELKYGPDNAPPVVAKHLRAQRLKAGSAWSFQVPSEVFVDSAAWSWEKGRSDAPTTKPGTDVAVEPVDAAPAAPPVPWGLARRPVEPVEDSSGDEVCFAGPLLATGPEPAAPAAAAPVASRVALARLGCAKKDRKAEPEAKPEAHAVGAAPDAADVPAPNGVGLRWASARNKCRENVPVEEEQASSEGLATTSPSDHGEVHGRAARSWWCQFLRLKLLETPGAASLKVSLAGLQLHDVDIPSLTAALDRFLEDLRGEWADVNAVSTKGVVPTPRPLQVLVDFDLSENRLTDSGAVWLFRWLMKRPHELGCRAIRLARNRLGDPSLEWLAALICQQHSALEELHLSDNSISATGAAHLLLAYALHPCEAYPFLDSEGFFAPGYLSLDRNPIHEPGLLARLRLRSNLRASCTDGTLRTSSFQKTPHVQLGATFPDEASRNATVLPLALEKLCAGGSWPVLPELPKPLPKAAEGGENGEALTRHCPQGQTLRRELLMDDDEGAGLELETVSEGLKVCEIMERPGQPGLRVNDLLVAIDGLPLWWHACQHDLVEDEEDDAPSARFRARFRRGARLDVLRAEVEAAAHTAGARRYRFACPVCWDGFDRWNDCLEHLRELGHEPPMDHTKKLEDASGSLRRWMATCMAAARGEFPRTGGRPRAKVEPPKVETLLLPARVGVLGERHRTVVECLAEEASRFGFEHGCTVWTLPNGLRAQGPKSPDGAEFRVASIAEELLKILHFHLPDLEDKEEEAFEDLELMEWTAWLEQMLQQQAEEDRRPQPDRGSDGQIVAPEEPGSRIAAARVPEIRLLLLCGLPGSGKSTLAARFAASPDWTVVNQDTLGSRQACMKAVRVALARKRKVLVDRCNVTRAQRALWTRLAKTEFHLSPSELACAWLDVPQEECARRVLQRFGHRTLPPQEASSKVIGGFARHFEEPQLTASAEGFGRVWRLRCEADEALLANELSLPTAAAQLPKPQRTVHPRKAKNKIPSQDFQPQQAPLEAPPEVRPDQLPEPKRVEKKSPAGGLVAPPETWTCSCGEINKIRRELCNNCFLPQSKRDEQASKLAISPCPDALSTCMSCATPPASALGTSDEAALQTIHAGPGESDAGGDESPSQTELRLLQRLRVPRVSADFEAEDTVVEGDLVQIGTASLGAEFAGFWRLPMPSLSEDDSPL
ncbi:Transcription factor bHLH140 (Basic helix-loop-helix protein 140) (AtbHLH140) (bHLH 140) (Transcription factor EN 122) (bHLH transcription factor bHLH140) [Durusdinium trenchii]|uniref:Transcription factor bHLH140 (Basic helix-loop-helix protein 140) (AtbHLH140) (BHLH 140) (Transcription factor EN 122) (BHLH transcription factor bHLH140) n=1 Tax=Durusdinium trenchii TaxID=1381693 RepID=A0ABP0K4W8_9DINO